MTRPERFDLLTLPGFGRRKKSGPDKKYATFNRRMLAATLDSLILMLLAPIIDRLFPLPPGLWQRYMEVAGNPQAMQQWWMQTLTDRDVVSSWVSGSLLEIALFCLYSGVCWHFWSATPGKMLLRIKVVDAKTEGHVTDGKIIIRLCGYIISGILLFLGFFWIGIDKRRQGWHDKLAGTTVIILPWRKAKLGSEAADPSGSPAPSSAE